MAENPCFCRQGMPETKGGVPNRERRIRRERGKRLCHGLVSDPDNAELRVLEKELEEVFWIIRITVPMPGAEYNLSPRSWK